MQSCGKQIANVEIYHPKLSIPEPQRFAALLEKRRIVEISRHGKWIIFHLEPKSAMLLHLRMSGRLAMLLPGDPLPKYCVAAFELKNGQRLAFSDARKFGRIIFTHCAKTYLQALGPDALSKQFRINYFQEMLRASRQKIKALLLGQRVVSGLGNIYADECCFAAGIHPLRQANSLRDGEIIRLYEAIQQILESSIALGGTSFDAVWTGGGYQKELQVFHRQGKVCLRCGETIQKIKSGGRGTHFCPKCQK